MKGKKGKTGGQVSTKTKRGFCGEIGFEVRKNWMLFLMLAPAVIYFIVFCYLPMGGIVLAFKKFEYDKGILGSPFIGLKNFEFLVSGGVLWRITKNTILYNIVFIAVDTVSQVALAIFLNEIRIKWFKKLNQSLMFLPYFISFVLLQTLVYGIFNYEYGLLNHIREFFGMTPYNAYSSPDIWKYILVFFHVWKGVGYGVVVYMATITGISSEYYEAAQIDGATKWQQIRSITLPLLRPTIVILTLFAVGNIMKGQFELFYQIIGNNGVLFETTDIIDTYVFRTITQSFDPGMATAAGLYQSAFGFVLIVTVNWIVKKIEPDYAMF